jgi:hypothetical protein
MKADQIADLELLDERFPGRRPRAAGNHLKWIKLFTMQIPGRANNVPE